MNAPSQRSSATELLVPHKASGGLLAAALSGLLGIGSVVACSSDTKPPDEQAQAYDSGVSTGGGGGSSGDAGTGTGGSENPSDAGADAPSTTYNNVLAKYDSGDIPMTEFQVMCDKRGGYVYVNAACAGGSMCKGLSFHNGTLWDHSCRGQNSACAGIGCVDMPADTGLTGKDIYADGPCGNCHGDWSGDKPDFTKYAVYYPPDMTEAAALKRFKARTPKETEAIIAWGTQGFHDDGTPFSNMPTYYQKYSVAEIKRVSDYVRSLTPFGYQYTIYGVSSPPPPDAGMPPDAGAPPAPDAGP